jgi:hypothetical protein
MTAHRKKYKYESNKNNCKCLLLFDKYGIDNCDIILLEEVEANNKMELQQREAHYIKTLKCINKYVPLRTHKEYNEDNKDKINEKQKQYREINKDKIKEQNKIYSENNKDKIKERQKKYRESNKDKIKEIQKKYNEDNKEQIKEKRKIKHIETYENNGDFSNPNLARVTAKRYCQMLYPNHIEYFTGCKGYSSFGECEIATEEEIHKMYPKTDFLKKR